MNYEIKISGSGTVEEIVASLKNIIEYIEDCDKTKTLDDGAQYEDPTLFAEIEIDEFEDEENTE